MGELFSRLKRLANKKGEVIVTNEAGDDAFVIMSLDRYEDLMDETDFYMDDCDCGEECDCMEKDFDFSVADEMPMVEKVEDTKVTEMDDKELMRRVNEDIAKWRKEQEKKEMNENIEEKTLNTVEIEDEEENSLLEEEKYYLEPLE